MSKWLSTALSHLQKPTVCVVGTQSELCREEEVKLKMETIKWKVSEWLEREKSFGTTRRFERKMSEETTTTKAILGGNIKRKLFRVIGNPKEVGKGIRAKLIQAEKTTITHEDFRFFVTSSATMEGIEELHSFLHICAKERSLVLPKHWHDLHFSINEKKKETDSFYLTEKECRDMYKKYVPTSFQTDQDFDLCL